MTPEITIPEVDVQIDPIPSPDVEQLAQSSKNEEDLEVVHGQMVRLQELKEEEERRNAIKAESVTSGKINEVTEDFDKALGTAKTAKEIKDRLRKQLGVKKLKDYEKVFRTERAVKTKELNVLEDQLADVTVKMGRIQMDIIFRDGIQIEPEEMDTFAKLSLKAESALEEEERETLEELRQKLLGKEELMANYLIHFKKEQELDAEATPLREKLAGFETIQKRINEARMDKKEALRVEKATMAELKGRVEYAQRKSKLELEKAEEILKAEGDILVKLRLQLNGLDENHSSYADVLKAYEDKLELYRTIEEIRDSKLVQSTQVQDVKEALGKRIQVAKQINIGENSYKTYMTMMQPLIAGEAGKLDLALSVTVKAGEGITASMGITVSGSIAYDNLSTVSASLGFSVKVAVSGSVDAKVKKVLTASAAAECGTAKKWTYKNAEHFCSALAHKVSRIAMAFRGGAQISAKPKDAEIELVSKMLNRSIKDLRQLESLSEEDFQKIVEVWRAGDPGTRQDIVPSSNDLEKMGLVHPPLIISILKSASVKPVESKSIKLASSGEFSTLLSIAGAKLEISDTFGTAYKEGDPGGPDKLKNKSFAFNASFAVDTFIANFSISYNWSTFDAVSPDASNISQGFGLQLTFPNLADVLTPEKLPKSLSKQKREKALSDLKNAMDGLSEDAEKQLVDALKANEKKVAAAKDHSTAKEVFKAITIIVGPAFRQSLSNVTEMLTRLEVTDQFGFGIKKAAGWAWDYKIKDKKPYLIRKFTIGKASTSFSVSIPIAFGPVPGSIETKLATSLERAWGEELVATSLSRVETVMGAIADADQHMLDTGRYTTKQEGQGLEAYTKGHKKELEEMFIAVITGKTGSGGASLIKGEVDGHADREGFYTFKDKADQNLKAKLKERFISVRDKARLFRTACQAFKDAGKSDKDATYTAALGAMKNFFSAKGELDGLLKEWKEVKKWPHQKLSAWYKEKKLKAEEQKKEQEYDVVVGKKLKVLIAMDKGNVKPPIKIEGDNDALKDIYIRALDQTKNIGDFMTHYNITFQVGGHKFAERQRMDYCLKQKKLETISNLTKELGILLANAKQKKLLDKGYIKEKISGKAPFFYKAYEEQVGRAAQLVLTSEYTLSIPKPKVK